MNKPNVTDQKWIDAISKVSADLGGSDIVPTFYTDTSAEVPDVNAYKTLKAFMERFRT